MKFVKIFSLEKSPIQYRLFLVNKYEEELHTYEYYTHTISMQAILLYLIHGDYPNKLLNHFILVATYLLILILLDLSLLLPCSQIKERLVGVIWVTPPQLPASV